MALQSLPPSPQILYANAFSNTRSLVPQKQSSVLASNRSLLFVDFVGLCSKSKRARRSLGAQSGRTFRGLSSKNWSSVKAVLELERVENALNKTNAISDLKPQVANLEDILSERGACGVGFVANLENKASYQIIKDALTALGCMEHRGGCGADNDSGDGSGLMTSIPWDLFDIWASDQGLPSFDKAHTGVGMLFLPNDHTLMEEAKTGGSFMSFEFINPPCPCICAKIISLHFVLGMHALQLISHEYKTQRQSFLEALES